MYNKSDVDSPELVGAAAAPNLLFSYCSPVLSAGPGQLPRLQEGAGSTEEDFVHALKGPSGGPACPSCLSTIGWTESTWRMLRMCCSNCVTKRNLIFKEKGMWALTVSPPSLHSGIGRVWKDGQFWAFPGRNGLSFHWYPSVKLTIFHRDLAGLLLDLIGKGMWANVRVSCSVMYDSLRPHGLSPPDSSVHGISQTRILKWGALSFSRGSSRLTDQTHVSCVAGRLFTIWVTREALLNT